VRVDVNGTGIEYQVTGDGPPVVLLHGFPDSGRLWRHQVPALADAGFEVIVPDMRGYGRSDKPAEVEAYRMNLLVGDVLAVLDDAGAERAHVVGHDWGASVAWATALMAAKRVERLVALSVGHPATFFANGSAPHEKPSEHHEKPSEHHEKPSEHHEKTFAQQEKSWYMLLFQFPEIAEEWLSRDGWANFRTWISHPDADAVVAELEASGSLTAALNYYRANMRPAFFLQRPLEMPQVQAPTMGVWSSGDPALTEGQMIRSASQVSGPWRYERLDGPGHWMQLEAPDVVNRLLIDFLGT
jgi:pimeloyl-ACP methyl ester carboxylesterase